MFFKDAISKPPFFFNNAEYQRKWREAHPDYHNNYYWKTREKRLEYTRRPYVKERAKLYALKPSRIIKKNEYDQKVKKEYKIKIFNHYCNYDIKCNCCGERQIEFLSIDHINNDGYQNRKRTGFRLYVWIIKNNFPPIFQILCMNCNWARAYQPDHICPHQKILVEKELRNE